MSILFSNNAEKEWKISVQWLCAVALSERTDKTAVTFANREKALSFMHERLNVASHSFRAVNLWDIKRNIA